MAPRSKDPRDEALRRSSSFPTTQPSRAFEKPGAWGRAWPWVAAAGLLLTALLTALAQRSLAHVEKQHLLDTARGLEAGFTQRLAAFEQRLGWAVRFLEARDRIPHGWSRVLLTVNPSTRPEGRVAVGYAAYVPRAEATAFETEARRRVAPRFVIKPKGSRPAAAPVLFFDPPLSGSDPLGFDLLSEPAMAPAVEAARDTATARLSDRTSFGRQRGAGTGVVLVLPVFDGAPDEDVEVRRRRVRGFLLAPLERSDLVPEPAAVGPLEYSLYAGDTPSYESLLVGSSARPILPRRDSVAHRLELAGRRLTLVAVATPAGRGGWPAVAAFWVPLVCGLAATLFAALHAHHRGADRGALVALEEERAAGRDTDTRVRALVDNVMQAVITYGADGAVQTYNRAAEAMFGHPPSQVIGKSVDWLLPRGPSIRHQQVTRTEQTGLRAGGVPFAAEVSVVPVAGAGQPLYVALVSDVTDRRIAEKQLSARLALSRVMAEAATLESAAPSILRSVAEGFEGSAAALWLVSAGGEELERFAVWGRTAQDENALRAAGEARLPRGRGLPGRVWAAGEPGHVTDRRPLPADERATVHLATRLALPLAGKKGVVGVVEFVTGRFDPDPARLDAMLSIASREVGQFIERKRTEAALVSSEARYRDFVSNVSHELRTPLASIHGSLGLLNAGALGELSQEAGEAVAIAERNAVRLLDLVNDILDLERLGSGRLAMSFAPTPMAELVDRSIEAVQAFADQKRMRIERLSLRGRAFADPDRMVQVLINLLSNAAKFSPPATTIALTSVESAGWVRVNVRDEGPGIPAADRTAVFERFRRGSGRGAAAKGGSGLGLAICKAIVEEHGGTIGVSSEEGRGSTFWFQVPATEVGLDEAAAHRSAPGPGL